jgi:cytidine deaminase
LKKIKNISYEQFASSSELPTDEQALLSAAMKATENAYAPYSEFFVGAAVALANGEVILGNNQENGAFPSGLCAERTALFSVGAAGKSSLIRKIAIRAHSARFKMDQAVGPCGACRQVMIEYERLSGEPMVVLLQGESGDIIRLVGVNENLLPFTFDLVNLKK